MDVTYIEFLYPGTFFAENSSRPVPRRELPEVIPGQATGYRFFTRAEAEHDGEKLVGQPKDYGGWTYFGMIRHIRWNQYQPVACAPASARARRSPAPCAPTFARLLTTKETMNELTTQGEPTFSLSPRSLAEAMEFAKIIASSDMVPKDYVNKPGNVLVAVQTGAELGLKPMQSLQGISVINGRPSIWGDAMRALVISHPEFEDLHEDKQDTHCTVTLKRRGRSAVVTTFTMEDAKKAGLAGKSGPWQTAPKRMLQMRAFAFAARDLFADALKGIKSTEELRDYPGRARRARHHAGAGCGRGGRAGPRRAAAVHAREVRREHAGLARHDPVGEKTPAALISMLSTKTILTEDQKLTIDSWAHEGE
jgi:hypothetical protein